MEAKDVCRRVVQSVALILSGVQGGKWGKVVYSRGGGGQRTSRYTLIGQERESSSSEPHILLHTAPPNPTLPHPL